jgi:uncharacterized protein (DUF2336 family)
MSSMDIMDNRKSPIAELEDAIQWGSPGKRVDTMRRVTDLFVGTADRLSEQQVELFDDVLGRLISKIEGTAIAELSARLGPIGNAPLDVVQKLARHDDIAVAEPILMHSPRLGDKDLIEIAHSKTQAHLLAISGRSQIGATVTDALLQRGDYDVFHKLAENNGANFSDLGFTTLVKHSESDPQLAEKVGVRLDIPPRLFQDLLARATETVRVRLLSSTGPEHRHRVARILATISDRTHHEAGYQSEQDYEQAHKRALLMLSKNKLNETAVLDDAKAGRYADMIAAMALLCGAPARMVGNLLQSEHAEALLIPCKAGGLAWPTACAVLASGAAGCSMSEPDFETARNDYVKLSPDSAKRGLRFWQVRHAASQDSSHDASHDARHNDSHAGAPLAPHGPAFQADSSLKMSAAG